ncbi:MAG: hypothetical protein HF300_07360 [Ignavibacteria bacterium]|jgi:hypothetical protein|nr:hypothetical protein [Ignavibacteria bacterium]MCU7499069.1 hypothetical protein [Ignavibacteria bacterium]MCU7512358.1 hypothetical protein [Ignavibacteria bacterium]MCU7522650.1 hypothetical protein [Ignavibacteria bacterium]MCU7526326.1 hypothetical protein [Ignavibacteria bacterium]
MIKMKEYIDWFGEEKETPLKMIATWYGLEMEKYKDRDYFDLENPITDKKSFSEFIYSVVSKYVKGEFVARLESTRAPWLPSFIEEELEDDSIRKYLDRFEWRKKYFGKISISDLKEFMDLFLDYPSKFSYQDILVFAKKCDLVIVFTHHGTIWFISKDINLLNNIASQLQLLGVKVVHVYENK